jgi:phospholipid N-methyltransferase
MTLRSFIQSIQNLSRFLIVATQDFARTGTLLPSTKAAGHAIASHLPTSKVIVVEYGSGSGAVVKSILSRIDSQSKLIGIEMNEKFFDILKQISDTRFLSVHQEVSLAAKNLRTFAASGVDAVVSGIPFSLIPKAKRKSIVEDTFDGLKAGGIFIVYQYTPTMYRSLRSVFKSVEIHFEPRNIPPYFILVAKKQ